MRASELRTVSGSRRGGSPRAAQAAGAWFLAGLVCLGGPAWAAGGHEVLRLDVGGVTRHVRVHPARGVDDAPAPLVLAFHGVGGSDRNFATAIRLHDAWPDATVAYPRGLRRKDRDGMRGWHGFAGRDHNNDLAFVDALLDELPRRYAVDPDRIYVTGFSNGGHLTFSLLMQRPCRFAAFAPVGALGEYLDTRGPARPVIYLFGRGEPREYSEAWADTVVLIGRRNRSTPDRRPWGGTLTAFTPAPGGEDFVYGLYEAGHVWPYDGNGQIVRFFREHPDSPCTPAADGPAGDGP